MTAQGASWERFLIKAKAEFIVHSIEHVCMTEHRVLSLSFMSAFLTDDQEVPVQSVRGCLYR